MRYCITCGNKLLDGDIYCGHCGAAVPDWLREVPGDDGDLPNEAPKSAPRGVKQPSEPNQPRGKSDDNKREAEEKHKGALKCPACGEILSPYENACPSCGFKLKEASEGAIGRLYQTISSIEEKRPKKEKTASTDISPTDKKIASAIKSFPIPSEKEDLIEFLSVANSNIDPYTDVHDVSKISESERLISKAWKSQFDQAYSKAERLFGNTRDFEQFKLMKESKEKELEDRQKANIAFKAILVVSWIALFLGLLGIPSALRACGAN